MLYKLGQRLSQTSFSSAILSVLYLKILIHETFLPKFLVHNNFPKKICFLKNLGPNNLGPKKFLAQRFGGKVNLGQKNLLLKNILGKKKCLG